MAHPVSLWSANNNTCRVFWGCFFVYTNYDVVYQILNTSFLVLWKSRKYIHIQAYKTPKFIPANNKLARCTRCLAKSLVMVAGNFISRRTHCCINILTSEHNTNILNTITFYSKIYLMFIGTKGTESAYW